jgi:hypothetical protein
MIGSYIQMMNDGSQGSISHKGLLARARNAQIYIRVSQLIKNDFALFAFPLKFVLLGYDRFAHEGKTLFRSGIKAMINLKC